MILLFSLSYFRSSQLLTPNQLLNQSQSNVPKHSLIQVILFSSIQTDLFARSVSMSKANAPPKEFANEISWNSSQKLKQFKLSCFSCSEIRFIMQPLSSSFKFKWRRVQWNRRKREIISRILKSIFRLQHIDSFGDAAMPRKLISLTVDTQTATSSPDWTNFKSIHWIYCRLL